MIEAGARARWAELRGTLEPFVARRVPAEDVDDVVQDVFLRLSRGLPSLRDEERFGPWVYRVARSAVADHLRARARAPFASLEGEEPVAEPDEPPLTEGERLLAPLVGAFVASLPSPYREALTLTELEGVSQREAAERVGITVSGMKSRVQRGRERLRESFEACCAIERDARGRVVEITPRPGGRVPEGCSC